MFEVHCTQRPSDATWTVVRSFWNLASDAATPEARSQDFEALMEGWKGDEFASDTTEGHVIERSVWVEGEQVRGRVVLRTRALPGEFGPSADSMAIEHGVVDATQIIETNGRSSRARTWWCGGPPTRRRFESG